MAYPQAAGTPSMSGGYIPTLYALQLLVEFYKATVFGEIANREYEGTISKHGDKVKIRTLPDITVHDFVNGQDLETDNPEGGLVELLIDKGKYFNMGINLVDQRQSDIDFIEKWAVHASEQVKIEIDKDILADIYSDVHASNKGATAGIDSGSYNLGTTGTPIQLTKTNILEVLVDCGSVLDEQNVPETDRWFVIPTWAAGLIKKSDLKEVSMSGDSETPIRNGRLGKIDRFTLYTSNQVAKTTDGSDTVSNFIFGQKSALTFASQITEKEILPNPKTFGKLMRSLQVFGYEVIKPEAMGTLYAYK